MVFKAKIQVMPKKGILDPQGAAVQKALQTMQYRNVEEVRIGKYLELWIAGEDEAAVREQVQEMAARLLANPVIEDFSFEIERPGV